MEKVSNDMDSESSRSWRIDLDESSRSGQSEEYSKPDHRHNADNGGGEEPSIWQNQELSQFEEEDQYPIIIINSWITN